MKAKTVWFILIVSMVSGNLWGQKNLDATRQELDKDPKVKKPDIIKSNAIKMASYSFDDPKLIEKTLKAFEKDKSDAVRIVKREGTNNSIKSINQSFTFRVDENDITYSFNQKEGENALLQYRMLDKNKVSFNFEGDLPDWQEMKDYVRNLHFSNVDYLDSMKIHFSNLNSINLDSIKMQLPNFDSIRMQLDFSKFSNFFESKPKYIIPKNGYLTINEKKVSAEEARKLGYNVETVPESEIKQTQEKPKFFIPKDSYIIINGKKITAEEARKLGYDVETF